MRLHVALVCCLLLSACSAVPPTSPADASSPGNAADAEVIYATEAQAQARCPNFTTVMGWAHYPAEAAARGMYRGEAVIAFTIRSSGQVEDVRTIRASHPIFAASAMAVVSQYRCNAFVGKEVNVQVPFSYAVR